MLSSEDITFYRRTGHIDITPYNDDCLQAASYDLHLSPYVSEPFIDTFTDPDTVLWTQPFKFDEDCRGNLTYILEPHAFALMSTVEEVWVSASLAAIVRGKSSRAREGLAIEFAGLVDPGFDGGLTLEVKNNLPFQIVLTGGMPICQITFEELRTPTRRPYGDRGHYQGQRGPTKSWESK